MNSCKSVLMWLIFFIIVDTAILMIFVPQFFATHTLSAFIIGGVTGAASTFFLSLLPGIRS